MSHYETIYEKVSETLCEAKDREPGSLSPEMTLPDLALDSLDYVELMVLAKREFNVTLETGMFLSRPFMTLSELCQLIEQEMAG
ncbi:acyl carrier protein [Intestinirhabdus alba]|uniref:Acyl carrier protein n=1 Tax=Intestinirhabdus alba TaxID=2899544 RepID=A0A6L6IQP6_9ENTR|nr:acyl carrier protein [Intestinirhabdus alba]